MDTPTLEGLLTLHPRWQVHRGTGAWTAVWPGPPGRAPRAEVTVADRDVPDVEAAVCALRHQIEVYDPTPAAALGIPPSVTVPSWIRSWAGRVLATLVRTIR